MRIVIQYNVQFFMGSMVLMFLVPCAVFFVLFGFVLCTQCARFSELSILIAHSVFSNIYWPVKQELSKCTLSSLQYLVYFNWMFQAYCTKLHLYGVGISPYHSMTES